MSDATEQEVLKLNQALLESIAAADWAGYERFCDPGLTAFEPEARGQLVEGLTFHKFYFEPARKAEPRNTTICAPRVRLMGDVAIVAYVRLTQRVGSDGRPATSVVEETRVWQRRAGSWKHVHFHRSIPQ